MAQILRFKTWQKNWQTTILIFFETEHVYYLLTETEKYSLLYWQFLQNMSNKGIESLPQTLMFLISISLQPNDVDLGYFKLWSMLDRIFLVWNIKGLHQQAANI